MRKAADADLEGMVRGIDHLPKKEETTEQDKADSSVFIKQKKLTDNYYPLPFLTKVRRH